MTIDLTNPRNGIPTAKHAEAAACRRAAAAARPLFGQGPRLGPAPARKSSAAPSGAPGNILAGQLDQLAVKTDAATSDRLAKLTPPTLRWKDALPLDALEALDLIRHACERTGENEIPVSPASLAAAMKTTASTAEELLSLLTGKGAVLVTHGAGGQPARYRPA